MTTRRADIQGLRAVAVAMVIAFHAGLSDGAPEGGGFTGVDVFFVISGFVITSSLVQRTQSGKSGIREFYERRVRRILPALALAIGLVAIMSMFLLSPLGPQQETAKTAAAASVFAANIQLYGVGTGYFDLPAHANTALHTWSLGVEEQFYLVFPWLVFAAWFIAQRRRASVRSDAATSVLFVLLAIGIAASFALSLIFSSRNPPLAFYASPTRAWEFGVGALLAVALPGPSKMSQRTSLITGAVGAGLIATAAAVIEPSTEFPGAAALLPVGGAVLLIAAGGTAIVGVNKVLASPPLVWLGDRSYSWYLWQWPAIVFAKAWWPYATWELLLAGAASIIPAALSYRFVENRIRYDSRYVGRRAVALVVVCILVPLLASGGLAASAHFASTTERARSVARDVLPLHADAIRGCDQKGPLGTLRPPVGCTWGDSASRGEVVLVGDSNAGQFTEPIARASVDAGFAFTVATASSCPFVALVVEDAASPLLDCGNYVEGTVDALVARHPSLVVLASASSKYINESRFTVVDPETGALVSRTSEKAELWTDGLRAVVEELDQQGIPVMVVHVIPHLSVFAPRECPAVRLLLDPSDCAEHLSRRDARRQRRLAVATEKAALDDAEHATALDLLDQLCDASGCAVHRDGRWIYRDALHLSVFGSRTLTEVFARAMEAQLLAES